MHALWWWHIMNYHCMPSLIEFLHFLALFIPTFLHLRWDMRTWNIPCLIKYIQRVGLYVGMAPKSPFILNKHNCPELSNTAVIYKARHTTCSTGVSIHGKTLKVGKIHHYIDLQWYTEILKLLNFFVITVFFLLLFQTVIITSKLTNVLTYINFHKTIPFSSVHDPWPTELS